MSTYIKTTSRLMIKFVQESTNEIILELPTTPLELHDYFKPDFIASIMRNTFGVDKMKKIGNIVIIVDVAYTLKG